MQIEITKNRELKSIWAIKNRCVDFLLSQNINTWDESYPSYSIFESDQQSGNLYSIYNRNQLIGAVSLNQEMSYEYEAMNWTNNDFLVIHRLMIDPKLQGRGYGKEAMILIEKLIAIKEVSSIRLAVCRCNKGPKSLYEKLGYTLKGEILLKNGLSFMYEKILLQKAALI